MGVLTAIGAAFALGWLGGRNATNRKAYAALWEAIIDIPDPKQCTLCGKGMRYHAPVLVNLSTGQMGEIQVYTNHPSRQGEILPMEAQQTGTFNFQICAGLMAARDTSKHICQVSLPAERELMNPVHFCKECRQLLAGVGLEGYVIADLYDFDNIQVYSVREGGHEVIRDYCVSVTSEEGAILSVYVKGLL